MYILVLLLFGALAIVFRAEGVDDNTALIAYIVLMAGAVIALVLDAVGKNIVKAIKETQPKRNVSRPIITRTTKED